MWHFTFPLWVQYSLQYWIKSLSLGYWIRMIVKTCLCVCSHYCLWYPLLNMVSHGSLTACTHHVTTYLSILTIVNQYKLPKGSNLILGLTKAWKAEMWRHVFTVTMIQQAWDNKGFLNRQLLSATHFFNNSKVVGSSIWGAPEGHYFSPLSSTPHMLFWQSLQYLALSYLIIVDGNCMHEWICDKSMKTNVHKVCTYKNASLNQWRHFWTFMLALSCILDNTALMPY